MLLDLDLHFGTVALHLDTRKLQNPIGTKANLNRTKYKAQYCD